MLEGLQTEIDAHPEFTGASNRIIMNALNADGSANTETWDTIPLDTQKIRLSKLKLLTYLTATERGALRTLLEDSTETAKDMAMLYNADDTFWINDPFFLGMLDTIAAVLSLDSAVVTEIKRLGERKISRAEELWSRKLQLEDFE